MITIYGIPEEVGRCYSCKEAIRLCNEYGIEYKFIPVLYNTKDGFDYHRDTIVSLAKLLNKQNLSIIYPQIFIDDKPVGGLSGLKSYIGDIYE
ncbi:glutaredoxin [Proteus phage vB_PmiM_Pm5461]|uniref:Glutaredoxin n=1 Tax=Proteus phage vB_PmiM_Pm5461 TaxID=1636250 RepID=A0A0G2SSG4_9CAUD|nr:glutaredoxin [Proteus phage vB_PmiM_Pm5461]AKA61921.1 glutaredoxin [Proteus phage vB_PmiM_Pm5461]